MTDQTLVYNGSGPAPYGSPFTISGSWPELSRKAWLNALLMYGYTPQKVPFSPSYEAYNLSYVDNEGHVVNFPLDPYDFPTRTTAEALQIKFGALNIVEVPFFTGGGPVSSAAIIRILVWSNGKYVNAGQLAEYYTRNPEDRFPGVADHLCQVVIDREVYGKV